jgi:hypothetical protein
VSRQPQTLSSGYQQPPRIFCAPLFIFSLPICAIKVPSALNYQLCIKVQIAQVLDFLCGAMVRSNPNFNDTAWMQNHAGEFFWTCDMCGVLYSAQTKCSQCPSRGPGGKGFVGSGKADFADQGKKGYGNQKGKQANQWQADASNFGKPTKGKGKAAYQWQQQNATN